MLRVKRSPYVPIRDDTTTTLSNNEHEMVRLALLHQLRMDGRTLTQLRPARIQLTRSALDGETGCTLQWGTVTVLCQCAGQIVPPTMDRPNEGFVQLSVELSPMASSGFKFGQAVTNGGGGASGGAFKSGGNAPLDDVQKLQANRILRCLENLMSSCLDTEALVITPGQSVWQLSIKITALDCAGGNILDAAVLATMAALRHYRQPATTTTSSFSDNDKTTEGATPVVETVSLDQKEGTPLPLHQTPLSISFAWLDKQEEAEKDAAHGKGGDHNTNNTPSTSSSTLLTDPQHEDGLEDMLLIVDPTLAEQRVATGNEIALNLNIHGEICGMLSTGAVTPALLQHCHTTAMKLLPQLSQYLETTLQQAHEQAIQEGMQRIQRQQQEQQQEQNVPDMDTEEKDDKEDSVLQAAEELYRKQALEYNLGHQAVQVRDNTKKANTPSQSRLLQSLLKSVSQQSTTEEAVVGTQTNASTTNLANVNQDEPENPKPTKVVYDSTGISVLKLDKPPEHDSNTFYDEKATALPPPPPKTQPVKPSALATGAAATTAGMLDSDEEDETMQLQTEFTDDNPDAVRAYNRDYQEMEEEETFWEDNRNTNHVASNISKKSFGPDKIKGGRVPKAPLPEPKEGEKPTAAQARRKEKNMSKRRDQQKKTMYKKTGA